MNEKKLLATVQCESQFDNLVCEHGGYCDNGLAYGLAQFHKPTFNDHCKGNYHSAKDQVVCMAQMWQKKLQYQWSCYK